MDIHNFRDSLISRCTKLLLVYVGSFILTMGFIDSATADMKTNGLLQYCLDLEVGTDGFMTEFIAPACIGAWITINTVPYRLTPSPGTKEASYQATRHKVPIINSEDGGNDDKDVKESGSTNNTDLVRESIHYAARIGLFHVDAHELNKQQIAFLLSGKGKIFLSSKAGQKWLIRDSLGMAWQHYLKHCPSGYGGSSGSGGWDYRTRRGGDYNRPQNYRKRSWDDRQDRQDDGDGDRPNKNSRQSYFGGSAASLNEQLLSYIKKQWIAKGNWEDNFPGQINTRQNLFD